jgi:hypothetical protein
MDNASLIKVCQQFRDWFIVPSPAKRLSQVIVRIDDRESRFINQGFFCDQL